jgi:two-component system chemotaxis response regulator CheB
MQFVPNTAPFVLDRKIQPTAATSYKKVDLDTFLPSIIVIGCSTGGPDALEKVFCNIKSPISCPILITQHMPPIFTKSLARRLQNLTGIESAEGIDSEAVRPNRIYIAPGDYHMSLVKQGTSLKIKIDQTPHRNSVRPAVDPLFESAAELYGQFCMGFILTGMGEDGLIGSKAIKEREGGIMIQSQKSCVVFGMPGAVYSAGLYDGIGDLTEISKTILRMSA